MSRHKGSSPEDLMVRIETKAGVDLLGWVVWSCEYSITLDICDFGSEYDRWRVSVPWDRVTVLADVTEFMTVGPKWAQREAV